MTIEQARCPSSSPWGRIQTTRKLAPGIWQVTTASHGGIYVTLGLYAAMPPYLKVPAKYAGPQWFEEDCEWALVALAYPAAFQRRHENGRTDYDYALDTVRSFYPEALVEHARQAA